MDYEAQIKRVNESSHFVIHNGIRAVELTDSSAAVEARITEASLNTMGGVHGGLMFLMAEAAAGLAVRNDGRRYVTLDSSFRFISGASGVDLLRAESTITKRGRSVAFLNARVLLPKTGKLLAEGEFTFYCLDSQE